MATLLSYLQRHLYVFCFCIVAASPGLASASTELLQAVRQGKVENVKRLLETPAGLAQVNISDAQGKSPLLIATWNNAVEIARLLIDAGADVNQQDNIQDSPYLLAGAQGRVEILAMCLAHGADLTSTNRYGGTALIPAAEKGHTQAVQLLLDAGVDPNHVNRLGWTALHEAIVLSDGGPEHQRIIQALLAGGADPNLADGNGIRPLSLATQRGHRQSAQILQAAGARP